MAKDYMSKGKETETQNMDAAAKHLELDEPIELIVLKERSAEHFSDDDLLVPYRTFTSCSRPSAPAKVV